MKSGSMVKDALVDLNKIAKRFPYESKIFDDNDGLNLLRSYSSWK